MNINDYLLTSLRDGQSAETLASNLSAALQSAEQQIAKEKRLCEQSSQLKTDLCDCLRKYVGAAHPQAYNKLIAMHGKDFTNDEIIEMIDNTIKNTVLALKFYESIANFCGDSVTTTEAPCGEAAATNWEKLATTTTNWEKLFGDFFNKYNL